MPLSFLFQKELLCHLLLLLVSVVNRWYAAVTDSLLCPRPQALRERESLEPRLQSRGNGVRKAEFRPVASQRKLPLSCCAIRGPCTQGSTCLWLQVRQFLKDHVPQYRRDVRKDFSFVLLASCTICTKKQNRHFVVPKDRLKILQVGALNPSCTVT